MLIYLHGFNSSPGSHKAQVLKHYMHERGMADLYCCPALPHEPGKAVSVIETRIAEYQRDSITLIGSSLGGFYATYFAERYGLRAILINPAVYPHLGLRAFLGTQRNLHTDEEYVLTEGHLSQLTRLHQQQVDPMRYLLLLETLDEILDYREALRKYRGSAHVVFEGGDHSLQSFPQLIPRILEYARIASL